MYSLKNGISILGREVLAGFGLTQSTKEIMMSDSSELLMKNICNTNTAMSSAASEVSDNFKHMKNLYTTTTTAGKVDLINDLKAASKHLSDEDIDELVDELFKNSDDLMKIVGTGIEYWQIIVGVIEMQEIQEEAIYRLLNALPENSSLADALVILLEDMHKDIVKHVFEHYCIDKSIELISEAIKATINGIANDTILPGAIATALGKLIVSVFTDYIYQGAMADDIVQTTYLSTYVTELEIAVMDYKTDFLLGDSVDPTTISEYEFIYSSYIAAIRTTLESALKMAKSDEKKLVQTAVSNCISYTYDMYIEICMQELKEDIVAGKVEAPENTPATNVTQAEAVAWIYEKEGQYLDYDGVYGAQCVDLIKYYYDFLGETPRKGNANHYIYDSYSGSKVPIGWTKIQYYSGFTARAGDIALFDYGEYGHIGLIVSADATGMTTLENNREDGSGTSVAKLGRRSYTSLDFWGVIRPKFADSDYSEPDTQGLIYTLSEDDSYYIVSGCDGSATNIDIPSRYNGLPVKEIGPSAFQRYFKGEISLKIPESITAIGYRALVCDNIVSLSVDENNEVFYSVNNCIIDRKTKTIIAGCNDSVIPNDGSVIAIGDYAFATRSSIINFNIPDSIISIGISAFEDCVNLKTITLPSSLKMIRSQAFWSCFSLSNVSIPDSVEQIDKNVFLECYSLSSITIPDSVVVMGETAFNNCNSLVSIYCEAKSQPASWNNLWLGNCTSDVYWNINEDYVFVESYTRVGDDYHFTVVYNLASCEQGALDIAIQEKDTQTDVLLSDLSVTINNGAGRHTFVINEKRITNRYLNFYLSELSNGDIYTYNYDLGLVPAESIEITNGNLFVDYVGKSYQLSPQISPANHLYDALVWSSSDSNVVSVDSNGRITLRKEGIAQITVTTESGLSDTITIVSTSSTYEKDGVKYNNVALGKSYVVNGAPYSGNRTDTNSNGNPIGKYTDGVLAHNGADTAIGCYEGTSVDVTVDLNGYYNIKAFKTDAFGGTWGIADPASLEVKIAVSNNGVTFTDVGVATMSDEVADGEWKFREFSLEDESDKLVAKYVRFTFTNTIIEKKYIWLSEIRVFGSATTNPALIYEENGIQYDNVALNKPYTVDSQQLYNNEKWTDIKTDGTSIGKYTDGILAVDGNDGANGCYVGSQITTTIDLECFSTIKAIRIDMYGNESWGIKNPENHQVKVEISKDGKTFEEIGYAKITDEYANGMWTYCEFELIAGEADLTARYVRLTYINTTDEKTFFWSSEIRVFGSKDNLVKDNGYTTTLAPSASYPDTNQSELTDGIKVTDEDIADPYYNDSRWVGTILDKTIRDFDIIMPLGDGETVYDLYKIMVNVGGDKIGAGVTEPDIVAYYSIDGDKWIKFGSYSRTGADNYAIDVAIEREVPA
ncbi:MAG: leucine-rich repeat protein, partial [Clostridia bacterium]|nr:leucine-rich repeat protein [Clostridia bacterium]